MTYGTNGVPSTSASSESEQRERALSALSYIPNGDRQVRLRVAGAVHAIFGDGGADIFFGWCEGASKPVSWRSMWKWACKQRNIKAGTLFFMARNEGWRPESSGQAYRPAKQASPNAAMIAAEQAKQKQAEDGRATVAERARAMTFPGSVTVVSSYLNKKGISPKMAHSWGLRSSQDILYVPAYSAKDYFRDGNLVLLDWQRILPDGKKLFSKNGDGATNKVLPLHGGRKLAVCEGFATGAAHFFLTGDTVFIAFTAHQSGEVIKMVRAAFPLAFITYVADNDVSMTGQNMADAVRCLVNKVALPKQTGHDAHDRLKGMGLI